MMPAGSMPLPRRSRTAGRLALACLALTPVAVFPVVAKLPARWPIGGVAWAAGTRATPAPQIQIDKSKIDLPNHRLTNHTTGDTWELLGLGDVAPILEAGGIFDYAKKVGMLKA